MKITSFLRVAVVTGGVLCAPSATRAADVVCRVSEKAVQQFADLVFPMQVSGAKKMSSLALGGLGGLGGEVRWTADVSKPVIRITAAERTFTATVKANAGGITWSGEVKGTLDIAYDSKGEALVVRVMDAIVPLSVGPVSVPIDVSQEVPTFRFSVALPEITIPEKRRVVRVEADPDVRYEDGAVVVSSDVNFELRGEAR